MKLLVYLRDGRTVYRIPGRKALSLLVRRDDPGNEDGPVHAEKGIWNPETEEYVWHPHPMRLRFLAKGSISHVEEDVFAYTQAAA